MEEKSSENNKVLFKKIYNWIVQNILTSDQNLAH